MPVPKPTYIYRIIHRENIQILIDEGKIVAPNFSTNKNYISIGETDLIRQRGNKSITIAPFGSMKDYITFYFGVRSPMLYCIKNGFDVQKRPQSEIIYLVSTVEKVIEHNCKFIFTDGHAFTALSRPFNDIRYLDQIDWNAVKLKIWKDTANDPDRKRRKEAEFLIHEKLPFEAIIGIVVYNQEANDYVSSVIKKNKINLPLNTVSDWYYE